MPTMQEILKTEREKRPGTVVLFDEGLFLKAYEESACRLAQQYGLKVKCRAVKAAGETVASVGFPKSSLAKYAPNAVGQGGHMEADGIEAGAVPFAEWKAEAAAADATSASADWLAEAVARYPVESKSPVECMLFLLELKKRLNYGKS